MQNPENNPIQEKKLATMSLLVALGVVLHRLEALLPLPSPWIKLGLANIMTLIALVFLGVREAFMVTVLRIVLGSFVGGTFLSPTFFLSLMGGLSATWIMALLYREGRPFSLVGISIAGAYGHTLAIFMIVYLLFIPQAMFLNLLPVFFFMALFSGTLTGLVANTLAQRFAGQGISFK